MEEKETAQLTGSYKWMHNEDSFEGKRQDQ